MINFKNTKIAFQSKSNGDLRKAEILFRALSRPLVVPLGKALTNLAFSINFPVGWIVKPTIYKYFVGGETIEKCMPVAEQLDQYNIKSILDYSVEGSGSSDAIQHALEETIRTIENASRHPEIPFGVFKLTGFGRDTMLEKASSDSQLTEDEEKEKDLFYERIDELCRTGYDYDVPVLIDAEDYAYQAHIDRVAESMMEKYNKEKPIVFTTLQMYRVDRLDYLKESIKKAREKGYYYGVKFVRGAYLEQERERAKQMGYPDPIQPDKESTDRDYNQALLHSIDNIDIVSVFNGTHNEYSSAYLAELMEERGIAKDDPRIYFSQLYGMSDHISFNLAALGYNVAKYLPYGPLRQVLPYLIRRAEENTSVKGQTGRELKLIVQEKERRRKQ